MAKVCSYANCCGKQGRPSITGLCALCHLPLNTLIFALSVMQCQSRLQIFRVKNTGSVFYLSGVAFCLGGLLVHYTGNEYYAYWELRYNFTVMKNSNNSPKRLKKAAAGYGMQIRSDNSKSIINSIKPKPSTNICMNGKMLEKWISSNTLNPHKPKTEHQ